MNKYSFKYFSIILRLLCFLHLLNLSVWEYWKHDPSSIFKLPVVNFLGDITPTIHLIIFFAYVLSSILFVIKKKNYSYSFTISVCLMYFELHDKYSFHHDIFLAINIYFLFSILSYQYYKRSIDSIIFKYSLFSMKLLLMIVYLFSGIHKINPFFHSGFLINDILSEGLLRINLLNDLISTQNIEFLSRIFSFFTIFVELFIPIIIWTKYRFWGSALAIFLHLSISFLGYRGIMFNLYLPSLMILFYNFSSSKVLVSKNWAKLLIKRIDMFKIVKIKNKNEISLIESFYHLQKSILFINPLFIVCFINYLFWVSKLSLDIIIDILKKVL